MKTFFTIFLAILAAAAVISGGLAAKSRLDTWKKAELECLTEINSMVGAIHEISEESHGGNISELTAALRGMAKAQRRIAETKQILVSLLENKPFGLPLTKNEKDLLRQTKADIQPAAEESKQKATPTLASEHATPSPPSQFSGTPDLTATPSPELITLVKPITVQVAHGSLTLQIGTKVRFISREGDSVRFHYLDADYDVPISATDLK